MLQKNNIPSLADLLRDDPERIDDFSCAQGGWRLDFSRVPLTRPDRDELARLPARHDLAAAIARLFEGRRVNTSEGQPALHMALRAQHPDQFPGAGPVKAQRDRFLDLADRLHRGMAGVTDLVHIGIGGSDLGPRLVADALDTDGSAVRVHWLSTLDGRRLRRLCDRLDPARTAMVVASKSFSTEETLVQARALREWLGADGSDRSFAATARIDRALEFGLDRERVLEMPSWTGGRYSLWSSVGVSAAARIGTDAFRELLAGAEKADTHYRAANSGESLVVWLALVMHYLRRGLELTTLGVVSYEPRLGLLADHLQQLVMESLGKGVDLDHRPVAHGTAPLIFGGRGTDLQHSIFQALHQGRDSHPLLLVGAERDEAGIEDWHRRQAAHLQAQADVLAHGHHDGEPYRRLPGNRPVVTLRVEQLDARRLGWLLASFEHAVYTLSVLWGINAFDQWGVEEGKRRAAHLRKQERQR